MEQATHPFTLRQPCATCATTYGVIEERNGQSCVYCAGCGRWLYNAPKTETGQRQRSVSTTHAGIQSGKRARVLERATGRCELCGAAGNLHVGHIMSVDDGYKQGLTDQEINHEENLLALCEECNLGFGSMSFSPRLYVALLRRRVNS